MTRSDADIERLLEDWLRVESKPMPRHVLESSLDAVSQTAQAGRWSRVDLPLRARRYGRVAAVLTAVLVVILTGPGIISILGRAFSPVGADRPTTPPPPTTPSAALVPTWNLMLTFRELNPAPDGYGHEAVFSYLRGSPTADPATYAPLTRYETARLPQWDDPTLAGLYVACCEVGGRLQLHPSGAGLDAVAAIVAWRNPEGRQPIVITGSVEVDASCGDGIVLTILRETTLLDRIAMSGGRDEFSIPVDAVDVGEVVYFVVDPGADSNCDTTWLEGIIESR